MDRRSRFYSERRSVGGFQEERIRASIELFKKLKGERLLDIGCADGAITIALMRAMGAREAYGVDIAADAVTAARERNIKGFCVDMDKDDLPLPDDYFDAVYCGEVIEHLFDPDHLLREIHRVLKSGGVACITTPNLAGWPNRLALLLGFHPYPMAASAEQEGLGKLLFRGEEGQWGHVRVFTLRALRELVTLHGFAIDTVRGCPVTVNSVNKLAPLASLVDRMLSRFPSISNRVILVLRKK